MRTEIDALPFNLGLGELLLSLRQRFLLGLAADGAKPRADLRQLVGYPGLGVLRLLMGRCIPKITSVPIPASFQG